LLLEGVIIKKRVQRLFSILFVSKALYLMIVYPADCLHKGIADGEADKIETVFKQVFAH